MPATLNAASSSFVRRGIRTATVLAVTLSRAVLAQPEEPEPIHLEPTSDPAATPPSPHEAEVSEAPEPLEEKLAPRVRITTVGPALPPESLERMLGPALKSSFSLQFSSTHRFQPQDLFRGRTGSPARIHVWVDTTSETTARIYFANRDGTRYLVRDLERSRPMDEMDREAISQAIEWSLQALSEGTAGMTREEAEELLANEPPAEADAALEPPPRPPPPSGTWRRKAEGWLPEVALLHRWTPQSAELPETQGPALRVGADRLSARHQISVAAGVHYQYPGRHAEDGVALELRAVGARVDGRYLSTGVLGASGMGLRLGLGFDAVFASAEALDWARFEAVDSSTSIVPMVTSGGVWQVRVEPSVRLEVDLGLEIDLVGVDYDLVTADGTRALVSRWPVRPSLGIGVALF